MEYIDIEKMIVYGMRKNRIDTVSRFLWKMRAIRYYQYNGKLMQSLVMWNPLSWVVVIALLCMVPYVRKNDKMRYRDIFTAIWEAITVIEYYKKNPDELRFADRKRYNDLLSRVGNYGR